MSEMDDFSFEVARRKACPLLISMSGTSGSGKTYSALLLAAGLAGNDGRVGMIDTENGRGSMYADSPGIVKALPQGYAIASLTPPYTPARYIAALRAAEKAGITVAVVDSASHGWEGIGGCQEMAETNKLKGMPNWALAKREHKRFVNYCLTTSMHLIFCLRARDKVKIAKDAQNKDQVIPIGIQPICEKGFVFEMLLSLLLDEQTHHAKPLKCPEMLVDLFRDPRLVTKTDGERIREWNASGALIDANELLRKRARVAAEDGVQAYLSFFKTLTRQEQATLKAMPEHERNKVRAEQVDASAAAEDGGYGEQSDGTLIVPQG